MVWPPRHHDPRGLLRETGAASACSRRSDTMNSFWLHPSLILILGALRAAAGARAPEEGLPAAHPDPALCAHPDHGPRRIRPGAFPRLDAGLWPRGRPELGLRLHHEPDVHPRHALRPARQGRRPAHRLVVLRRRLDRLHLRGRLHHAVPVLGADGVLLGVPDLVPGPAGIAGRGLPLPAGARRRRRGPAGRHRAPLQRAGQAGPSTCWMSTTRPPPFI